MYQSLVQKSVVQVVNSNVAQFAIGSATDGLTLNTSSFVPSSTTIPSRLHDWLLDLRLLRNIPLAYLVADSALLPPESIRFFHVDLTWIDRVIDGVFAAANTGSVDIIYSCAIMQAVRNTLDADLNALAKQQVASSAWNSASDPMTGMLIRSDLVRRWPDMIVQAYVAAGDRVVNNPDATKDKTTPTMATLRCETLSNDVLVALFAGEPALVTIQEPHVGLRFGVEDVQSDPVKSCTGLYDLKQRDATGEEPNANARICVALKGSTRVIDVNDLANKAMAAGGANGGRSRMVAIELLRQAFVQRFLLTVSETQGWTPLLHFIIDGEFQPIALSNGRFLQTEKLAQRAAQLNINVQEQS